MAYPLGWSVVQQTAIRRERWPGKYRANAIPLVYPGQEVQPDQPIIRLEVLQRATTGPVHSQITSRMPVGASSGANPSSPDAQTARNQNVVAGLAPAIGTPPVTGASSNIGTPPTIGTPPATGAPSIIGTPPTIGVPHAINVISETIPSGLRGRVVDITRRGGVIIESRAAVVQGVIGAGNQIAGILTLWQSHGQQQIPPGAILIIPGPLNFAMLRQAISSGVVGVVASSVSSRDLEGFLQADLVELLNSIDIEAAQAHLPPMTLLLTEGLGTIAMPVRTINLLSQYQGSIALLSGITSARQGIRPELIISLPAKEAQQNWHPVQPDPTLVIGAQVRVCAGNHEGVIGEVNHIFIHQQVFPSGVRSRAVRLRLEDGSMLVVPITLIERIG